MHHPTKLEELVTRNPRYPCEAYEFVFAALTHTQEMLDRAPPPEGSDGQDYHVNGPQLLDGVRDLALREFGLMARTVFRMWGVNRTDDIGEIVFNLIEDGLMSKTDRDDRADFHDLFDLDQALVNDYRIEVAKEAEEAI
jgi:uncharacterized repeat protein (TIGR04138 family)